MVMRTLDLTLEGTTSDSRDTATGINPPMGQQWGRERQVKEAKTGVGLRSRR
jgi:hypothetical protein